MDLRLPDIGGAEAIHAIVEAHPSMRVLVLTAVSEAAAVATAIRAGASGFLAKDTPVEEVVGGGPSDNPGRRVVVPARR